MIKNFMSILMIIFHINTFEDTKYCVNLIFLSYEHIFFDHLRNNQLNDHVLVH